MHLLKLAVCSIPFALPALAQESGDDRQPPAAAVSLERGAYAEEYERDLVLALEHYRMALAAAEAMEDAAQVEAARAAIARVERRQGEAPTSEEAEALQEQMESRIGTVLSTLKNTMTAGGPRTGLQRTAGSELAVFGTTATDVIELLMDGQYHKVGGYNVALPASDLAGALAFMESREGDDAMARLARAPNPHVRREIVRVATPERHHALLVAAAADDVAAVREAAIARLASAPQPGDAALLRAALADGVISAVRGLYALDSAAVIASALAPDASEDLRRIVAWRVLEDERGAPTPAGARLLARLALEPREGWDDVQERLVKNLDKLWSLPEESRAAFETELLARLTDRPSARAVELLVMTGSVRSLAAFGALMREQGLESGGFLTSIVARTPEAQLAQLARTLDEFPVEPWRYSVAKGLAGLRWDEDGGNLIAFWRALDDEHRALLVRALAGWFERGDEHRTRLAGGDADTARRPGSLSPQLLPLARELVRAPDEGYIAVGLHALQAIGTIEGLREALAFHGSTDGRVVQGARAAAVAIVGADPVGARDVIVASLLEGWRLRPEAAPISPSVLRLLPDSQAIEAFARLWPQAPADGALREALLLRLFEAQGRPEATALLVEHFDDFPPGLESRRSYVLKRVGSELYEPGIELLEAALRDRDDEVRAQAFGAFKAFRSHREQLAEFEAWKRGEDARKSAYEELLELLGSESRAVRLGAVQALGTMRAKDALPALVRLLEGDDAELQQAVRMAITRMSD